MKTKRFLTFLLAGLMTLSLSFALAGCGSRYVPLPQEEPTIQDTYDFDDSIYDDEPDIPDQPDSSVAVGDPSDPYAGLLVEGVLASGEKVWLDEGLVLQYANEVRAWCYDKRTSRLYGVTGEAGWWDPSPAYHRSPNLVMAGVYTVHNYQSDEFGDGMLMLVSDDGVSFGYNGPGDVGVIYGGVRMYYSEGSQRFVTWQEINLF
ncbi:hypothetical protein FWF93_00050 [Candidatus Saccharibacteria bacterium]|nr:hypothetical protein [Candidatus Saccharibacteria bacterium]